MSPNHTHTVYITQCALLAFSGMCQSVHICLFLQAWCGWITAGPLRAAESTAWAGLNLIFFGDCIHVHSLFYVVFNFLKQLYSIWSLGVYSLQELSAVGIRLVSQLCIHPVQAAEICKASTCLADNLTVSHGCFMSPETMFYRLMMDAVLLPFPLSFMASIRLYTIWLVRLRYEVIRK